MILKSKENKFFSLKLYILFLMVCFLVVAIDHFYFGTKLIFILRSNTFWPVSWTKLKTLQLFVNQI